MKVAVVGSGLSGATTVKELVTTVADSDKLEIHVFEPREKLIVGQAYQDETHEAIMNEHARDISIINENSRDFLEWAAENYPQGATRDAFVPRDVFGQYLHDRLYPFYEKDSVVVHHLEIVDMIVDGDDHRLVDSQGQVHGDYSAVFFAIGHPPYSDHYNLAGTEGYYNNPFPIQEEVAQVADGKTAGVIGSGLTSLDIVKFLINQTALKLPLKIIIHSEEPYNTVKFYRYDGPVEMTFSDQWIAEQLELGDGHIPMDVLVETFLDDVKKNNIDFDRLVETYGNGTLDEIKLALERNEEEQARLRRYIVMMTIYIPDLYNAMTQSERDVFTDKYEQIFNHFRAQMPAESLSFIMEQVDAGNIEFVMLTEEIEALSEDGGGFLVKTQEGEVHEVDLLFNAGGFQQDLTKAVAFDPLLKNLYDKEMIIPYHRGGIHVTWPKCQVVTLNEGHFDHVYLLGHWITNIHYGNNNIHLCIKQAERVARSFLEDVGLG